MPTEGFEKGKLYFEDENGEYKELADGTIEDISVSEDEEVDIFGSCTHEYSFEFEIKDKKAIREMRKLLKTDKVRKREQRYNKESFRKFIKGKK